MVATTSSFNSRPLSPRDPNLQTDTASSSGSKGFGTGTAVGIAVGLSLSVTLIALIILLSRYRRVKASLAAARANLPSTEQKYERVSVEAPLDLPPPIRQTSNSRSGSPMSYRYLTNARLYISRSIRSGTTRTTRGSHPIPVAQNSLSTTDAHSLRRSTLEDDQRDFRHPVIQLITPTPSTPHAPAFPTYQTYVDPWHQDTGPSKSGFALESVPLMDEEVLHSSKSSRASGSSMTYVAEPLSEPYDVDRPGEDKPDRYMSFHGSYHAV
ncbi:hypothetical protein BT69DRAFT_1332073 [Atractiella rhizophila]|nr:hypothetical protein BT69DRAFT_1335307 [Atractiella rhizophila]KAH8925486.1 hypothetical protein BT69DRAFT_1332073 [Atractiella rhizophila]